MSPLEQHVTQALGKAQPGAAVDFGIIMQIMLTVLQFIQQCPFGNARRAIHTGAVEAKVAAYRAVKASGYDGNAVDLTNALIEQGRQATDDELDATIASAHALPGLMHSLSAVLFTWLTVSSAASAGPFPEYAQCVTESGPFPLASLSVRVGDEATDELLNPDPRILNPLPPTLRDRIDDFRTHGGGSVGVRGMSITTHLLRDHRWDPAQLAGLTSDELYLLHGMQHAGRIDPHEVDREPAAVDDGYPITRSGNTTYWQVDGVRWSNLGGGPPVEGRTYTGGGRSFVYYNGRMHLAGSSRTRTEEGCAGGQCRIR